MTPDPDALLGGRVRYAQPEAGFRSGIEPVLLAASIPARPGETVLEGGTGAGAALLCLASRVQGLRGLGIERDPSLAELARTNLATNGFAGIAIATGDLTTWSGQPDQPLFDHAFANPPYHEASGTPPQSPSRDSAKRGGPGLLAAWTRALAGHLRRRGTLTLILPAARLPEALAGFAAARCGSAAIMPLWPQAGRTAKLLLARAVREGRGPCRLLPGLALHEAGGGYTAAAEAVLRRGAALPF